MGRPASTVPTILFRGAVLIACVAMLMGVAGVFHFGLLTDPGGVMARHMPISVRLGGLEDLDSVQVVVHWDAAEGGLRSETGRAGEELGEWFFERAPLDEPLTLTVYRREDRLRRRLHQQPAVFSLGVDFVVQVAVPSGG